MKKNLVKKPSKIAPPSLDHEGLKYDLIAKEFAAMRQEFYREQKYLDLFINELKPGDTVLDVGCGSGHPIASYLISKGLYVVGIDSSKSLLEIARNQCPNLKTIFGDVRTVKLKEKFDGIIEWWCLFHLPKVDHMPMIRRFSDWLKPGGILEFTSGDKAYEATSSDMLNQELNSFSLDPSDYEKALKLNGFKILLRESDQDEHLVWIAQYENT